MRTTTPLAIDTANRVINEQEDAIASLKHQVYDREDQRDEALERVLVLKKCLRRIECSDNIEAAHRIAAEILVETPI